MQRLWPGGTPSDHRTVAALGRQLPLEGNYKPGIGPWGAGPFVRPFKPVTGGTLEAVVGHWALIGDRDTKAVNQSRMTNNAHSEELAVKPTYRGLGPVASAA